MHRYLLRIPRWIKWIFPHYVWHLPAPEKAVYLTFDDGPHPMITPWVLEELEKHNAQATFFCIGANVNRYPAVFETLMTAGHSVGNHTYHHRNGWQTDTATYVADVEQAGTLISSRLFRPPYGRIRKAQARRLRAAGLKIILWEVLSADFDRSFTPEQCAAVVLKHTVPGSIIVFHDSEKAAKNLKGALPVVLKELGAKGFVFRRIEG